MEAVKTQAELNLTKVESILELYDETKREVVLATSSQYRSALIDALFIRPIFNATFVQEYVSEQHESNVSRATINTNLNKLVEAGILQITRKGSGSAATIYAFQKLLDIVQ